MAEKRSSLAPVPIALVEDDRPYRGYVAALLNGSPRWKVVLEADSVEEALRQGTGLRPRVLLLDVGLPGRSGARAVAEFLELWPEVTVVMLTGLDGDDVLLESIRAGASGYLLKGGSSEDVTTAVEDALAGHAPMSPTIARRVLELMRRLPPASPAGSAELLPLLTAREHEIVALVADGLSDKEISTRIEAAVSTVKNHLANVYTKWRVRSRTEAAVKFTRARGEG